MSLTVQDFYTKLTQSKGDYIEKVVQIWEQEDLDLSQIAEWVKANQHVYSVIRQEAEDLKYLSKISRLPT